MQVIFLKDMKKQAKKGEIKEVKDGYANFLINNGIAVKVNSNSIRELDRENKKEEKRKELEKQQALELKKKLDDKIIEFKVKVGAGDRVFGSISPKQIKDKLKEENIIIDKSQIELNSNLTILGFHDVVIKLHKEVESVIKVHIVK